MKIFEPSRVQSQEPRAETRLAESFRSRLSSGFTMVEIALCLAIIGIALVAIIGVLPIGINTQKDNREETLINQDATVLMEDIRSGARGLNDLTNYVYAISNYWTAYKRYDAPGVSGVNSYTYTSRSIAPPYPQVGSWLTNGANIIGLLSTPEYTDNNGAPIPSLVYGGFSNHIVAYVRSLSGPAFEKPPQDNSIILGDSFSYKIFCNNAPLAVDTNLFFQYPRWLAQDYSTNGISDPADFPTVMYNWAYWRATADTSSSDVPGFSARWAQVPDASLELAANLRELRLTFVWPLLPNGRLGSSGSSPHTFATTVAGQMIQTNANNYWLYFFQPQSFSSTP